jgi:D-glycero-beta-D-manno-heptose 1-phosphate adenylyltransferase
MPDFFSIELLASKILPDLTLLAALPQTTAELAMVSEPLNDLIKLKPLIEFKNSGQKLVFTNGVFDLLHRGHLSYLMASRNRGQALMVAVNTDASVKRLNKKGDRPINPLSERLLMLAALPWVDFVIPFSENTPVELLKKIQPKLYTKAGDYDLNSLPELPVMQKLGGAVEIIPFEEGFSSSKIIEKVISSITLNIQPPKNT